MNEIDPFDDGAFCRSRFWLFLSYCISIASAVMAVWVLLHFYAWNETGVPIWPGVAAIFQVSFLLVHQHMCFTLHGQLVTALRGQHVLLPMDLSGMLAHSLIFAQSEHNKLHATILPIS